jgi:hypothetical protein
MATGLPKMGVERFWGETRSKQQFLQVHLPLALHDSRRRIKRALFADNLQKVSREFFHRATPVQEERRRTQVSDKSGGVSRKNSCREAREKFLFFLSVFCVIISQTRAINHATRWHERIYRYWLLILPFFISKFALQDIYHNSSA